MINNPVATYRIQFHSGFKFADFEQVLQYLKKLGVSTVYASPVFESVPGSTHGYDSVNPHRINPQIGTEAELKAISQKLKDSNMNWLQDIVPNHMGFHQNNLWLMDVLEKGKRSVYASFFDAVWTSALFKDEPVMVPFLGGSIEDAVKSGELKLDLQANGLVFRYFDNYYPLHPASYATVLQSPTVALPENLKLWIKQTETLRSINDAGSYGLKWSAFKQKLLNIIAKQETKAFFDQQLAVVNADKELLLSITNQQAYRLCSWEETDNTINYRRFFTVNGLICLNIQDKAVFNHFHQAIKTWVDDGIFQGLRIDHIDGLYDPDQYLNRLRSLVGSDTYIVAEKILEQNENLPANWPIQGTSGYDYLAIVNNLLTNSSANKKFNRFYSELVTDKHTVQEKIWRKKSLILSGYMNGELENLYQLFNKLRLADKKVMSGIQQDELKQAIGQLLVHCPVYRYYGNQLPLAQKEYNAVKALFELTKRNQHALKPALNLLEVLLLEKPKLGNTEYNERALQFYQRLMQFSGPLMAKGVEDTLMYSYNQFIAHNEVGDAPDAFGISVKQYHKLMKQRQTVWPLALNATSTHDTKRGEDVRARLNALTGMPKKWVKTVKQWQQLNAGLKQNNAPDVNDEYFIYQTIVGAYPMPGQHDDDFGSRLKEYLIKALREAKTNSNWTSPNEVYEQAVLNFADSIINTESSFSPVFQKFHQSVVDYGIVNSLVQVLLKFTSPGIPDVYQGCELWDLSLVDPDNRRPVDYALRNRLINDTESIADPLELTEQLWQTRYNGQIKQWLTQKLFTLRKNEINTFTEGNYIPLQIKGAYKDYIVAYVRRHERVWYITVAPLYIAELCRDTKQRITEINWKNTRVILPREAPTRWQHQWLNTTAITADSSLKIKELFINLPFALIKLEHSVNQRGAGVLMPVTSLPSPFGVGDMGPAAKAFAIFLSNSGQKYWQLLPLNPTGAEQQYSPYSSSSSMAGNTLLISPEALVEAGLLVPDDLKEYCLPVKDKVPYSEVEHNKAQLLNQAYHNFRQQTPGNLVVAYQQFCNKEVLWLNDYSLFIVLKEQLNNQPWYTWPDDYRLRKQAALRRFASTHASELDKVKWLQFIFFKQWANLKTYCNSLNIQMFGDLPFYVSHDSVDVWTNPSIFKLDGQSQMAGIAGVPPDYFSADGQLWNMPVYRWDVLKKSNYSWWINRLKKNMQLFDLLRLDHFRAFANYWEVPAGETTARNGQWVNGPANDFFEAVQSALAGLPFIAEDLGDIDEPVFALRDKYNLPGMKILQFAFGNNLANSLYTPHNYEENYVVYTGTHDNNTTVGWYNQDINKTTKQQLNQYTGSTVKAKNVHHILTRAAYASTAKIVIIPMQDIIGLDENSRMNNPSKSKGNWLWRLMDQDLADAEQILLEWVKLYNRV